MFLFQYLDYLPPVPDNLVSDILSGIKNMPVDNMPPMRSIKNGNQVFENVLYKRYTPNQELLDWIHNNISNQYTTIGVQIQDPGKTNHTHAPHADASFRNWVLNYSLQTGGPNVITSWYQCNGAPVVRPSPEAYRPADITEFEKIESVQFEPCRWHLLNASILHGVENIQTDRISISLGFELDPLSENLLCKK